jgi:hypothetical protein
MRTLVVCALVFMAGCNKPVPRADKDYFGKAVAPPRGLANVRPGMTKQEALAAGVQRLKPGVYGVPSGVRDIDLITLFDDEYQTRPAPRVAQLLVYVHEPAATHLTGWLRDAWGAPVVDTGPLQVWQGDAWRAQVTHNPGPTLSLSPAVTAAFWGHVPGALPEPLANLRRGMKKPEIDALVPNAIIDDFIGVVYDGDLRPEGLSRITLFLNTDHALPLLLRTWGDGTVVAGDHVYEDPASGWRATLHTDRVGNVSLEYEPLVH